MVALLASYFFSGSVHLSSLAYRLEGTTDYDLTQVWTSPYVPGARYLDKSVYILTSERTFSAAEEFTYDLQALKRATIVGGTTSGQAHATFEARIDDHFEILLPTGKTLNPVTGADWEGTGVVPDVKVPADEALAAALKLIRERAP